MALTAASGDAAEEMGGAVVADATALVAGRIPLTCRHLLALGRQRVAFLGTASQQYPEFAERHRGYAQALRTGHCVADPRLQVDAVSAQQSGYEAACALLARDVPFDAIFAASDLIAIGAMQALGEHGRRVPEDVAVVGFDDIPMASFVNPALTTVAQDSGRAGELLVGNLLKLIHGQPVESAMFPAQLVVRRSCGSR